jgi:chitinase
VLPEVTIQVPPEAGYLLTCKEGGKLGIADIEIVQRELFKKVRKHAGSLLLAVNAAYYVEGDAIICGTWGTHGTDKATSLILHTRARPSARVCTRVLYLS